MSRARRGRIRLYLAPAPGTGKTHRLLEDARALAAAGIDVVVGYAGTDGDAKKTSELSSGLELAPLQRIEYRGVEIEELDLSALLARRPHTAVVDDLAHTNAPTCRNRRRYEDVRDLAVAGIDVLTAVDVRHLDGLADVIRRSTGSAPRETIPDSFLREVDELVCLDLATEDLVQRAAAAQAPPETLSVLRELALREVIDRLDRKNEASLGSAPSAGGRIMVCLSSRSPRAALLLRRGSRMAGRLNRHWFAVYVETPGERPERIDSKTRDQLHDAIRTAEELGAEVVRVRAEDAVRGILDFASSHGVSDIVVGFSERPWYRHLLGRSVPMRLLASARGFDVHVISVEGEE